MVQAFYYGMLGRRERQALHRRAGAYYKTEELDAFKYYIAGENLLWSRLPYESYLGPDALGAATTPRELSTNIVQRYNQPGASSELIGASRAQAVAPCSPAPGVTAGQPQIEPQLTYYNDASQLAFTRDAPKWAELLVKLDPGTLPRQKAPSNAPYPARSLSEIYLPTLQR